MIKNLIIQLINFLKIQNKNIKNIKVITIAIKEKIKLGYKNILKI